MWLVRVVVNMIVIITLVVMGSAVLDSMMTCVHWKSVLTSMMFGASMSSLMIMRDNWMVGHVMWLNIMSSVNNNMLVWLRMMSWSSMVWCSVMHSCLLVDWNVMSSCWVMN